MTDYVLSLVDHLGIPQVEVWERSLRRSGFNGAVVLFAYSPDQSLSSWCSEHLVQLLHLDGHPVPPKRHNKERWRIYADFIGESQITDDSLVIATDTRDVCFQRDPARWLKKNMSGDLILSSEGICYHMDTWNRQHALEVAGPEIYAKLLRDRTVVNAGVVAGRATRFTSFCRDVYDLAYQHPSNPSDQIVLNLVAAKQSLATTTLEDGWACHGTVHPVLPEPRPTIVNDEVCTPSEIPYAIVHQYQNHPEWRLLVERKYHKI